MIKKSNHKSLMKFKNVVGNIMLEQNVVNKFKNTLTSKPIKEAEKRRHR
jgi:hypothetical protein